MLAALLNLLGLKKTNGNGRFEHAPGKDRSDTVVKHFIVRYADKTDVYSVDFRPQSDGTIKLFAISHPADPWGKSVQENHLYSSGQICVAAGHEPRTADRAKAIAMVWCKGWSDYVRTGRFPSGTKKVNIP